MEVSELHFSSLLINDKKNLCERRGGKECSRSQYVDSVYIHTEQEQQPAN